MAQEHKFLPMMIALFGMAFAASFSESLMSVPLASIMSDFQIESATAQWLITGYMIVGANMMAIAAFLLRRLGRRRLFIASALIFFAAGLAAMFAPNFALLLLFRLIQAMGTGASIACMTSTIFAAAPVEKQCSFMAIGGAIITVGPAVGPVLTGVMVSFFGWRSVFFLTCVISLIFGGIGVFTVYDTDERGQAPLDVLSLFLSVAGLSATMNGLVQILINPVAFVVSFAVGMVLLGLFVWRQSKLSQPLLCVSVLKVRPFTACCLLDMAIMMATFSFSVTLPLFLQGSLMLGAAVSGVLCMVPVFADIAATFPAGKIMDKRGEWPLFPLSFALQTVGLVMMALGGVNMSLVTVITGCVVLAVGAGMCFMPVQTSGLRSLPEAVNADGVALLNVFVQIAGCIGSSLFVGLYQARATDTLLAGLSQSASQAQGYALAMTVMAGIALLATVLAFVYGRRQRRG